MLAFAKTSQQPMKSINYSLISSILLVFITFQSYSQITGNSESSEVIGKLLDESQIEVIYASVSLMLNNKTVVNTAISSTIGEFKIVDVTPGTYTLRIDHFEQEQYTSEPFTVLTNEIKIIPDIILKPSVNSLNEVVVTKKKRLNV